MHSWRSLESNKTAIAQFLPQQVSHLTGRLYRLRYNKYAFTQPSVMLREKLKQELDRLNEDQLKKIADFISLIQSQSNQVTSSFVPFWLIATPAERASEFRDWVSQLPKTSVSLPDEAFNRDRIYEE